MCLEWPEADHSRRDAPGHLHTPPPQHAASDPLLAQLCQPESLPEGLSMGWCGPGMHAVWSGAWWPVHGWPQDTCHLDDWLASVPGLLRDCAKVLLLPRWLKYNKI